MNNKLYNVKQVAELTGYAIAYVRRLLREGKIEGVKPGGGDKAEWRVTQAALDTFLNAKSEAKHNRYRVEYDSVGNFAITDTLGGKKEYAAMTQDFKEDMAELGYIRFASRQQAYYSSKDLARLTEEAFVKAGAYAASLG